MPNSASSSTPRESSLLFAETGGRETEVIRLLTMLLRWRRVLVVLSVLGALALAGPELMRHREFVSAATILPEHQGSASNVQGLAAQLGLSVPAQGAGESPALYESLVDSRTILSRVADTTYTLGADSRPRDLAALLNVPASAPAARRDAAIRFLNGAISASTDAKTGIVTVRAKTASPVLSRALAANVVEQLATFNRDRRKTNAANERQFAANRLVEATAELNAAEAALQSFLEHNRGDFRQSPTLSLDHDRLTRQVALKSEMQLTLAQALERARVDEAREAPSFSVIDAPEVPLSPEPRGLALRVLIGIVFGLFAGTLIAFIAETTRTESMHGGDEVLELQELRREALRDLRNPLRLVRRSNGHVSPRT